VRVGGARAVVYRAHGRTTKVTIDLGLGSGRTVRVAFVEHIKVGRHPETISFTRIYHRCG
jgi:hypothetical protein